MAEDTTDGQAEEECDKLPDESTEGIYDAPPGLDPEEWRRHVEVSFTLKKMNRLKRNLERIEVQALDEWKVKTGFDDVQPKDIREEDLDEDEVDDTDSSQDDGVDSPEEEDVEGDGEDGFEFEDDGEVSKNTTANDEATEDLEAKLGTAYGEENGNQE